MGLVLRRQSRENEVTDRLGFDINPVMVMVAKADCLNLTVLESNDALASDIKRKAKIIDVELSNDDMLAEWFTTSVIETVRRLEKAIFTLLIDSDCNFDLLSSHGLSRVSALASILLHTALFLVVRSLVGPFRSSNPTWIRSVLNDSQRVDSDFDSIIALFDDCVMQGKRKLSIKENKSESEDEHPLCN